MTILPFVIDVCNHLSGSEYGQSGNYPVDPDMPQEMQEAIGAAVLRGHNAAVAMNQGNMAMAGYHRDMWGVLRRKYEGKWELTYGQWDVAYSEGYNRARKEVESCS